ncbi:MAG: hypothetical protein LUH82_07865, partial [Clostridiales bacterium]|nr:hypothetical protein [Clostridiales bacterium]
MKLILKKTAAVLMTLLFVFAACPSVASAAESGIDYLGTNGTKQLCENYTVVIYSTTIWESGWYAVTSDVEIDDLVTVTGDVRLILADGCTLTCSSGINVSEGNCLSIYAQSTDELTMGVLITTGSGRQAGIGGGFFESCGTITINGGAVSATGGLESAGIGGGAYGNGSDITINGGTVTA